MASAYRHVIFDIDGTMIDTERTGVLSFLQTLKELTGREMSYDEAYSYYGIPSAKVGEVIGYSDSLHFQDVWETHFMELRHLITPFPGIPELIQDLHAAGVSMSLVTSRSRKELEADAHLAPMLPLFTCAVCAEDAERPKPFPDPVYAVLRKVSEELGVVIDAGDCLFLGDTKHDYGCASAAGCDFALVDWRGRGMQGLAPEHYITDIRSIYGILL